MREILIMIRRVIVYFYICSCLLSYDPVKRVRVFRKTCTTFVENMYVFFQKYNHVLRLMIINDLHIRVICMLIVWIY